MDKKQQVFRLTGLHMQAVLQLVLAEIGNEKPEKADELLGLLYRGEASLGLSVRMSKDALQMEVAAIDANETGAHFTDALMRMQGPLAVVNTDADVTITNLASLN